MLFEAERVRDWRPLLLWHLLLGITIWRMERQRRRVEKNLFAFLAIAMLGLAANHFWGSPSASLLGMWLLPAGLSYVGLACLALWNALTSRDIYHLHGFLYPKIDAPHEERLESHPVQDEAPGKR